MARGRVDQYGTHTDNYPDSLRYHQTAHSFELGGHKYRCNPLKPVEQLHLARRLAPILLAALKPEDGRKAILARLMKFAALAKAEQSSEPAAASSEDVINDALDLATSVFEAAAATNEEMVNVILKTVLKKVFRENGDGGALPVWSDQLEGPHQRDIDGFTMLSLVIRYLVLEFHEVISEYIKNLGVTPGPVLMAAAGMGQRPPGAPGTI